MNAMRQIRQALTDVFSKAVFMSVWICLGSAAFADTPISLFQNYLGQFNYQITGGSFRLESNAGDSCALGPTSNNVLLGIPATATIRSAFLYWAGSGSTVDTAVRLNGSNVVADRSFTATFDLSGTDLDFFSGFADVTGLVSGNGVYSVSDLAVNAGDPHCSVSAVMAGWTLIVIYEDPNESLRAVNLFDGFQLFRGDEITLMPDRFRIPVSAIDGKYSVVTWEGDPQNSGSLNGFNESLAINGSILDDGLVPPGSNPIQQPFDGTINSLTQANAYGVDIDTYDISAFLSPGDTSATTNFRTGADLVLLSIEIISVTTDPLVDLVLLKSHTGDFQVESDHDYVLNVSNIGSDNEANTVTVSDTLPVGLSFVSAVGAGWSCSAVVQTITCQNSSGIVTGASLADLTITVHVTQPAVPVVNNSATVTSPSSDIDLSNNTASDPTNVIGPQLMMTNSSTVIQDPFNGSVSPKAIPGAIVEYTVIVENHGAGQTDADTLVITDLIPAESAIFVDTSAGDPVEFVDGSTPSGLVFDFTTDVGFSSQPGGGPPYDHVPIPDVDGIDPTITGLRVNPGGAMNSASGGNASGFQILYRVRVN